MRRGLISVAIFVAFVAIFTLSRHAVSTTTTSTSSTTTVSSSTTTSSTPGTGCNGRDFKGTFNQGQGAAGTIYASVTLTKVSAGSCSEKGWPLLTLQDVHGTTLVANVVDVPSSTQGVQFADPKANRAPTALVLTKGSTTTFSLAYSDVPTGTTACDNAVTLNVQFAASSTSVVVTPAYPLQPCDNGRVWVSPFY